MDQREPFRFLRRREFDNLTSAEKIVYLDGATAELKRRGEELRSFTQLIAEGKLPAARYRVRSRLSGEER